MSLKLRLCKKPTKFEKKIFSNIKSTSKLFFQIFVTFSNYLNFNENFFMLSKSTIKIQQSPLLQYPYSQGSFTSLPFDGSGFFQGPNNWAFEGDWATSLSVNVRAALNSDHRHYNQDNGAFINFQACSRQQQMVKVRKYQNAIMKLLFA